MASLQFEGDLSGLSDRQVEFIRDVIAKRGYENNRVLFGAVGKIGDNYVANVKRITVITDGDDDFTTIIKIAPQSEITREMMSAPAMFVNEITMYEKVLPRFTSLEKSVGIPENERLKYAKCYGSLSEEPYELILLEDLKLLDFTILDRFVPLEDDAVKLTLKNFAVLHSLSFVLKKLEPETFEAYKSSLLDVMFRTDQKDNITFVFKEIEETALGVLDDEDYKRAVRGNVSEYFTYLMKLQNYENDKHLIVQQGDAWTNNIMFRKEDGKVVDSIMIDYQLSRAANPVCDLLYFIFNCTDHDNRSKNYHNWIDYYHEELDKSLSNFGLKASLIYPREQVDIDLKSFSKLFFCMSVLLASMVIRNEDEAAMAKDAMKSDDLEAITANLSAASLSTETIDIFKVRLIDLIKSYREFGYLP